MEHSFDIEAAQKYGVNAAVILRHLQYWIIKNKTHKKNFHDGRHWTYYSVSAFTKIFPYLSKKQVRKALQILIDNKVVIKGDYNKFRNTRTSWYAFVDENSFAPEGKPEKIPSALKDKPVAPEGKPSALEGKPFAPGGKLFTDKDKDKLTNKETDNPDVSQKSDLSAKDEQHLGFSLLVCRCVDEKVARSLVYKQKTPLSSIEEVVKNGLAKEDEAKRTGGDFRLEPGYIVQALNQARSEGKVVNPTNLSKIFSEKLKRPKFKPLNPEEFEERKSRQIAALNP